MNTTVWLIRFTDRAGQPQAATYGHNAIADFRDIDPNATIEQFDVLALADLLAADLRLDQVVRDTNDHHRSVVASYPHIQASMTRELCERYIAAELDRAAALERCQPAAAPAAPAILKNNADIGPVAA